MSKYKSLKNFSIPDGKDSDGWQKKRYFVKGEVYEVSEKVAAWLGGRYFEIYAEPEKPKRKEKKPDIRTRKKK